jgi:two-component system NtrC family response regulator
MKTLLIVDDEVKICALLSRFFASRGFRTLTASSGHEALERLHTETPDYLLLDIRMPDLSGLEVLKLAKQRHPNLIVVMVSAMDDTDTVHAAFQLGASDYVRKPFELNDLAWARAFFSEGS